MSDPISPTPDTPPPPEPPAPRGMGWCYGVLGCIVLAAIVSGSTWWHVGTGDASYEFGRVVGVSFWIILLFYVIAGRGHGWRVNLIAWVIIVLGLGSGAAISASRTRRHIEESRQSQMHLARDLYQLGQDVHNASATGGTISRLTDDVPKPHQSDTEILEAVSRASINVMIDYRNAYAQDIERARCAELLSGTRIKADVDGSEGQRIVDDTRASYDRYRTKASAYFRVARARLAAAPIAEAMRRDALQGFDNALARNGKELTTQLDLERQVITECVAVHDWLRAHPAWHVDAGRFIFDTTEDLAEFQRLMGIVNATIAKQQAMQQQSLERTQHVMTRTGPGAPGSPSAP